MNRKKLATSVIALGMAAVLALGGTFAWQSISQTALNEAGDVINPGGRLHDDFNGENKDIYVENFAEEPIYVRVRLQEYMEIVMNYGTDAEKTEYPIGASRNLTGGVVSTPEGSIYYPDTTEYEYRTYIFDEENRNEDGTFRAGIGEDGNSYWTWTMGGVDSEPVYYMPTFNLNKDSLVADINGSYKAATGVISDRDGDQYENYVVYSEGDKVDGYEIYDKDTNSTDELKDLTPEQLRSLIANGTISESLAPEINAELLAEYAKNIGLEEATHYAGVVATPTHDMISMADWLAACGDGVQDEVTGCWVYDTDGWIYWSAPLQPYETTALLLDGIKLSGVMDDSWYYAINVEAQFVTADDVGKSDNTGFYQKPWDVPSEDAEWMLWLISEQAMTDLKPDDATGDESGEEMTIPFTVSTDDPDESVIVVASEGSEGNSYYTERYEGSAHTFTINHTDEDATYTLHVKKNSDQFAGYVTEADSEDPTLLNVYGYNSALYDWDVLVATWDTSTHTLTLQPNKGLVSDYIWVSAECEEEGTNDILHLNLTTTYSGT